jgi:IS30 family transposase
MGRRPDERRTSFIMPRKAARSAPAIVLTRNRRGDGNGDLVGGAASRWAIGTLVDRATRYLPLVHLPIDRSAEAMPEALTAVLSQLPESPRLTLT